MGRDAQVFDRFSIRTKLIAIVAAPLAVIIALAGLGFTQRRAEATETRADVARLDVVQAAQALQRELEVETLFSVTWVASEGERSEDDLAAQRRRTNEAATGLERSLAALAADEPALPDAESALRQVAQLDGSLRTQVDERILAWQAVEQIYRQVQGALPPLADRLVRSISDRDVADGAASIVALGDYTSSQARIGVLVAGAAIDGGWQGTDALDVRPGFEEAVDRASVQLAIVSSEAGSATRVRLRNQMAGGDISFFVDQVSALRGAAADDPVRLDADRWTRAVGATLDQLREITASQATGVVAAAADRVETADADARLFLAGALLAVLLALGLAIVVAASIARPVMNLTAAADRVANEQLPRLVESLRSPTEGDIDLLRTQMEQIDVGGGRELARLSASVSSIQDVAVDVATEQAALLRKGIGDMFVNLARRNQGLLDRQLEYIDELEAEEEDPDQLEHLFKLDHMATRMRRNAESLLVLAGAEPTRRRGQPVPLTKVALAAVGEIEHFARIDLLDVDEADVASKAAADVAHLLSELMENATQFSPPDTRVEVIGHHSVANGYTVSITDQGIGMSSGQLEEANALLAHPPLLGLTLARTLGFIVVARLAARHGISVRLVAAPAGGVTAIVNLPPELLVRAAGTVDVTAPEDAVAPAVEAFDMTTFDVPARLVAEDPEPLDVAVVADDLPAPVAALPEVPDLPAPVPAGRHPLDEVPDRPAPATLEEAVPSGAAFAEGLSRVVDGAPAATSGPEPLPDGLVTPIARRPLFGGADGPPAADGSAPLPTRNRDGAAANRIPHDGPRLFGAGGPPPAAPAEGAHLFRPPPAPPAAGRPERANGLGSGASRPPAAPVLPPAAPVLPPSARVAPPPAPAPAPPAPAPAPASPTASLPSGERTAAGLVKRVPRRAGGDRPMPGSDGNGRGTTTSTRSPDEVRSMLSRFHSGKQAAQAAPPPAPGADAPSPLDPEEI